MTLGGLTARPAGPDEFASFRRTMARIHGWEATEREIELEASRFEPDRSLVIVDGTSIVATAGAFSLTVSLPGADSPAAGVTAVAVHPSYRRRGLMSFLVRRLCSDAAARDEPLAALYSSRGSLYNRLGFGVATWNVTFETSVGGEALRPCEPSTEVDWCDPATFAGFASAYEQARRNRPGAPRRREADWALRTGSTHRVPPSAALATRAGEPVGYVLYRIEGGWSPHGGSEVVVVELVASDAAAARDLWHFMVGLQPLQRLRAPARPPDDALPYLFSDVRSVRRTDEVDGMWLRVLDVPRVLAARTYEADGAVVVEIVNGEGSPASYELVVDSGVGNCETTAREPDVTLSADVLGSFVLGGSRLATLRDAGLVREHTPGAVERLHRLVSTSVAPWCPWGF